MSTESELTYRDVQMVLALLDGWPEGRARLRMGELEVEVELASPLVAASPGAGVVERSVARRPVAAPAVGWVRLPADAPPAGQRVEAGRVIGFVECDDRRVPVAMPQEGCVQQWLVADGDFVQYGQDIVMVVPEASGGEQ